MRLHRLRLRHVKGVTELSLDFPDTGVVVVEGPNEVGKSTLLEALDRLLDPSCKATSKSAGVKAMQPVGVEAAPFVEAELSLGGYRLVFAKQWLLRPTTTLRVLASRPEQLAGEAAQARMTAILSECLDRPLFDALRFTQAGEPQIPLTSSRLLAEALDGAAGADLHTDTGADLLGEVEGEFLRYFTRTGRPTGELRAAITETETARDAAVHAHTRVGEAQDLLEQRESAVATLRAAELGTPEVSAALEVAQARAVAATAVDQELRAAQERAEAAQAADTRARGDHDLRQRMVGEVHEHHESVTALSDDVDRRARDEQPLVLREATAQQAAQAAATALARAREVAERAGDDATHLAEVTELARLRDRLQRSEQLSAELATAQAVLEESTITPAVLRQLTDLSGAVELARATIEGAATVVSLQGLGEQLSVEVDGTPLHLAADGEVHEHLVSQETSLVLPGVLQLSVRPQGDVVLLAQRLAHAQSALAAALAKAAVGDLDTARQRCVAHETAAAETHRLRTELAGALGGESADVLGARVTDLQACTEAYLFARGDADGLPETVAQAKAVQLAAKDEVEHHLAASARAQDDAEEARRAWGTARSGLEVARARLQQTAATLQAQEQRLAEARAECDDDAVREAQQSAAVMASEAQDRLAQARQAAAEVDVQGVQAALRWATEALEAHRVQVSELRDRSHHLKGSVELCAGEGRQEVYELALQAFAEARAALRSIERRARAARQLHQTLQRHREQAHDAYVAPFAAAVDRLGRQVYGDTFGVVVSRDLVLTHRHLHDTTVPFESLSGGAKEQLGILARLAVASLVDADQGVPVVIDDALGYTDPARLRSVGRVLADPGSSGQVILLTCNPQRYAAMEGATTISLTPNRLTA